MHCARTTIRTAISVARTDAFSVRSVSKVVVMAPCSVTEETRSSDVTAGIVIIGDEILKGQTQDVNTYFLAQRLRSLGIRLAKVSVVSDDVDSIADEVKSFSSKFSVVLTAGGIGPTHDDVTFEGVAKAFGDSVELNPYIVKFIERWHKTTDLENPAFKLARIPTKSKLNFGLDKKTGKKSAFPLVSIDNVYVFPGIPDLLQRSFDGVAQDVLRHLTGRVFFSRECFTTEPETRLADKLNELVRKYPRVTFGSYPEWEHSYYKTKITFESVDEDQVVSAKEDFERMVPALDFDARPVENAAAKLEAFRSQCGDPAFASVLSEAMETVEKCFRDYGPDGVMVCFNGGKDCIAMLHLAYAYHSKHFPGRKLQALYIKEEDPFPEVEQFVLRTEREYNLEAVNVGGPMKSAVQKVLSERPTVKAMILGTRMGDPGSHYQDLFAPTDGDWPKMMRVNPVLHWEYQHVWTFLRGLCLAYPSLYDQGYSSLGGAHNTRKNPALRYVDATGKEHYKPAYQLMDGSLERNGRGH